jgi:ribosome-associated protein
MNPEVLNSLRAAARALDAKKAFHLVALDVAARTSIADAFMICSVGSSRQAHAAAEEVERELKLLGRRPLAIEGLPHASWVLMDYGDFILHIFMEEQREYYALDRLWGDAPAVPDLLERP